MPFGKLVALRFFKYRILIIICIFAIDKIQKCVSDEEL